MGRPGLEREEQSPLLQTTPAPLPARPSTSSGPALPAACWDRDQRLGVEWGWGCMCVHMCAHAGEGGKDTHAHTCAPTKTSENRKDSKRDSEGHGEWINSKEDRDGERRWETQDETEWWERPGKGEKERDQGGRWSCARGETEAPRGRGAGPGHCQAQR